MGNKSDRETRGRTAKSALGTRAMGKGKATAWPLALTTERPDAELAEALRVLAIRRLAEDGVRLPADAGKEHMGSFLPPARKAMRKSKPAR
jgi:hypothetical protein